MTRRRVPVPSDVAAFVFARDGYCLAPLLDPDCGPCGGRSTLEHVKDQLRMAVRAPSLITHLVALCENHTEPGMKAGRSWNLVKENREKVRAYLRSVNGTKAEAAA